MLAPEYREEDAQFYLGINVTGWISRERRSSDLPTSSTLRYMYFTIEPHLTVLGWGRGGIEWMV